jgi:hypothetical protein
VSAQVSVRMSLPGSAQSLAPASSLATTTTTKGDVNPSSVGPRETSSVTAKPKVTKVPRAATKPLRQPPQQRQQPDQRRPRLNEIQWEGMFSSLFCLHLVAATSKNRTMDSLTLILCNLFLPDMYHRLVQYKKEHGDCLVPRKYEKDPKLAIWCEGTFE